MSNMNEQHDNPAQLFTAITVQIPKGSEAAFGKLVNAWGDAVIAVTAPNKNSSRPSAHSSTELLSAATAWWRSLNAKERAIWNLWIESAPELVPASRIVSELGLKGTNSIKGVINRMAPKGDKVGFQVGWQSHKTDPITREPLYGVRDFGTGEYVLDRLQISGLEYARLLQEARSAAEA